MILRTKRSLTAHSVDATLTALAWAGFFYLIGSGIVAVLREEPAALALPVWSSLLPTIDTLLVYVVAAAFNGAVAVCWARYNRVRYGRLVRRRRHTTSHDARGALAFCASSAQLAQLRECRNGIVHHDVDGIIRSVDMPASRLFLVPGAA